MKDFLAHHSYLIIWILALIIVGSIAIFIVQLNGITTGPLNQRPSATGITPSAPALPPVPSVTLTIVKSAGGNSLFVQWQNLPSNTMALNIWRGETGTTSTWMLWKTLTLAPGETINGTANIDLGASLDAGYSFYVQAVTTNDNSTSTTIIWTSSSTTPIVTTSTPGSGPSSGNNPPPDNTPPSPSSSPSTPSSSSPGTPSSTVPGQPSSSNPGTPGTGNNSSTSPGNPYYNPQIQITGYGTAPGSFWVEHLNQSIEIGWQNIPTGVDTIVVGRSPNSTGPWTAIITQKNPGSNGSYSLQLVDDNLNQPNYYEMTAFEATTTIATYGPVYLEAGN